MRFKWFKIVAIFLQAQILVAGSMSSGGGELLGDSTNPWFLQKIEGDPVPPRISYCIEVGREFAFEKTRLQDLVKRSINWWNDQLSNAYLYENTIRLPGNGSLKARIGPTLLGAVESSECSEKDDLRFQFGVLRDNQIKDLSDDGIDPSKFVGMAIRTGYSSAMRGKGFIYISPDRGPLAMKSPFVIPSIWEKLSQSSESEPQELGAIVRHELGHVLGIPHTATGLMGAKTPELAVSDLYSMAIRSAMQMPVFYPGPMKFESCDRQTHQLLFKFFGVPADQQCVGVYADLSRFLGWTRSKNGSEQMMFVRQSINSGYQVRHHELTSISLPPIRTVFRAVPDYIHQLKSLGTTEVKQEIMLKLNDGSERSIFIQRDTNNSELGGVLDGRVYSDLIPELSGFMP